MFTRKYDTAMKLNPVLNNRGISDPRISTPKGTSAPRNNIPDCLQKNLPNARSYLQQLNFEEKKSLLQRMKRIETRPNQTISHRGKSSVVMWNSQEIGSPLVSGGLHQGARRQRQLDVES
jgi:hypothetical protein